MRILTILLNTTLLFLSLTGLQSTSFSSDNIILEKEINCPFKANTYRGNLTSYGIKIINLQKNKNYYNITIDLYNLYINCSQENIKCDKNNNIILPNNNSDCLRKHFSEYNINPQIKYNINSNYIEVIQWGLNIILYPFK